MLKRKPFLLPAKDPMEDQRFLNFHFSVILQKQPWAAYGSQVATCRSQPFPDAIVLIKI